MKEAVVFVNSVNISLVEKVVCAHKMCFTLFLVTEVNKIEQLSDVSS